jgi:hypothetical protein
MQATATRMGEQLELGIVLRPAKKTRRRSDGLPEFTRYKDDGCSVSESCLTCPLPRCRYEEPGGLRALLNEMRDQEMLRMRRKGATVDELAGRFDVSRRTVFRVLGSSKAARRRRTITVLPAWPAGRQAAITLTPALTRRHADIPSRDEPRVA